VADHVFSNTGDCR